MKRILTAVAALVAVLTVAACDWGQNTTSKTVTKAGGTAPASSSQPKYQTPYGPSAHSPYFGLPPANTPRTLAPTAAPTTAMYDSTTVSALPAGSKVYAGYTSGWWPTAVPLAQRFPSAKVITIAVNASHYAQCLDVEPGDATPAQVPGWITADKQHGFTKPCVYSSLSEWAQIRPLLSASTLASIFKWDADWTYSARLDAGFDATQWTDHWNGRNVDASVVTDAFAGLVVSPDVTKANVMHYERYDSTVRHFGTDHAQERNTVKTWDARSCENPVRRAVCKSSRNHLQKLRKRLLNLHAAGRPWNEPAKPSASGPRNQQMWKRINATKPITSWAAGA